VSDYPHCYLCGRQMTKDDRNYFDASGIATCLVCPKDDPDGHLLVEALRERTEQRRSR
jgi:hypothetical protein